MTIMTPFLTEKQMKQIRPLSAFKKANKKHFDLITTSADSKIHSKKQQEIIWYFQYCCLHLSSNFDEEFPQDKDAWFKFFFTASGYKRRNVLIISEIGRVMLYGWYYDINEFAERIAMFIIRSMLKNEGKLNDIEYKEACTHIRNNIGYYYQNENELKLYIVRKLFKDELQVLLPEPPERLKFIDEVHTILQNEEKRNLIKNKRHYIEETYKYQEYSIYLELLLEEYNVFYDNFETFTKKEQEKNKDFIQEIEELENEYEKQIRNIDYSKLLT